MLIDRGNIIRLSFTIKTAVLGIAVIFCSWFFLDLPFSVAVAFATILGLHLLEEEKHRRNRRKQIEKEKRRQEKEEKEERRRKKKAGEIKKLYDQALDSGNRRLALKYGREYYASTREDGDLTIYDEQCIQNDLLSIDEKK